MELSDVVWKGAEWGILKWSGCIRVELSEMVVG